jgi:TRAP-type C4-dicarboxylate transport system permease small subunit
MKGLAAIALPRILQVLEWVCAILLFTMMMLTFIDVVGRYLFTAPVFGAAEMIQFLLAITIFAGLSLVNAHDDHIVVELFEPAIKRKLGPMHRYIVQGFSVLAMAFITWELYQFAREAHELAKTTIVLEWPLVAVAGSVAVLSATSLIAQILGLFLAEEDHAVTDHASPL